MSLTSVDLPEPDTPVTATNSPSGKATSTFWRLCSRAPEDGQLASRGARAAYGRHRDLAAAGEVLRR